MKKFLFVLALLWPGLAFGQCNGVFSANQVCGSIAGGPPGPAAFSSFPAGPPTGSAGGVLTGTYPNPGMSSGAAATNVGSLGGDLTGTLPNPTIGTNVVTNAKAAQAVTNTVKGNPTSGIANVQDMSVPSCSILNNFLQWITNTGFSCGAFSQTAPTVQRFTSGSGTYTPTTGTVRIRVRMIGGGGGGTAATTNTGSTGTNSNFGIWTARGGAGAVFTNGGAGGTGGVNGTGTLVVRLNGEDGRSPTPTGGSGVGAAGGGSAFFGGGGAGLSVNNGEAGVANSGGGGAGGASGSSQGYGGGGGESVEFLVANPSATSYSVGSGGNGGAPGGNSGGAGGAGIIIIEEFYI